jgi:hypothetical protein
MNLLKVLVPAVPQGNKTLFLIFSFVANHVHLNSDNKVPLPIVPKAQQKLNLLVYDHSGPNFSIFKPK